MKTFLLRSESETLRHIISTWDQLMAAKAAGLMAVAITQEYTWAIGSPVYGSKIFDLDGFRVILCNSEEPNRNHRDRQAACEERAKRWASKSHGVGEWKRNALRDWVPAEIQKRWPIRRAKCGDKNKT